MSDFLKIMKGQNLKTLKKHNDSYPKWYVDSGNYALNLQVSGMMDGGFRGRCAWQFAGEESTGKTRVWIQAMKRFLNEDEKRFGVLYSTENEQELDEELLDLYGEGRILIFPENDLNKVETEMLKMFERMEKMDPNDNDIRTMVVLDSWGLMVHHNIVDKALEGKQSMMDLMDVKMKNEFAKKLTYRPLHSNSIMIITNHVYIPPEQFATAKTSGGKKLAHFCQGTLVLTKNKADKDKRDEQTMMKVEMRKGRNPIKEGTSITVPMEYYKGGLTRYGGLFELCYEQLGAIVQPSKGWYQWADQPDGKKFQKKAVLDNPEEFFEIEDRKRFIEEKAQGIFCYRNDENDD